MKRQKTIAKTKNPLIKKGSFHSFTESGNKIRKDDRNEDYIMRRMVVPGRCCKEIFTPI